MELQERGEWKDEKDIETLVRKSRPLPSKKRCLLTLDLHLFRLYVKDKHSADKNSRV